MDELVEPFSKFLDASEAENECRAIAENVPWTTPPQSTTKPLKIGVLGVPPLTPSDRRGARILASRSSKLISNGKTRLTLSPLYRVGGGRALAPRFSVQNTNDLPNKKSAAGVRAFFEQWAQPTFWPSESAWSQAWSWVGRPKKSCFLYTGDFALSNFHHFLPFYPILPKIGPFP